MNPPSAPLHQEDITQPYFIIHSKHFHHAVSYLLQNIRDDDFDATASRILHLANFSMHERDGRSLSVVVRLVFKKATEDTSRSELYARLSRYITNQLSPLVRDEIINRTLDGKPITGGHIFLKYLLNQCQEDFERGLETEKEGSSGDQEQEDRRPRRLGLAKFIGELFKLQLLTERIMHECIKRTLSNVENPKGAEIETLCQLLKTVGELLDTPKARNHMDIYFGRMDELAKGGQVDSGIQLMLVVSSVIHPCRKACANSHAGCHQLAKA